MGGQVNKLPLRARPASPAKALGLTVRRAGAACARTRSLRSLRQRTHVRRASLLTALEGFRGVVGRALSAKVNNRDLLCGLFLVRHPVAYTV